MAEATENPPSEDASSLEDRLQGGISVASPDLNDPSLYINAEMSWLRFDERVLEEAENRALPLLERVKFLGIFANNLDEFFMIRVSGLLRQVIAGAVTSPPDAMTPDEQLSAIRDGLQGLISRQDATWREDLHPALGRAGITVTTCAALSSQQKEWLRRHFADEIFPVLTPLAIDQSHPFPLISNLSLNLAVVVDDGEQGERFARLKVADAASPRLVWLPSEAGDAPGTETCVWLEDVVATHIDMLFPGIEVIAAYPFRITRDAELEITEDEAADLLTNIEEHVELRQWGSVVRLELDSRTSRNLRDVLIRNLGLEAHQVYDVEGPLGQASLLELTRLDRPDLLFATFQPRIPPELSGGNIFEAIRHRDILLYHPYDSFTPVVDFIRAAAADPDVMGIKQTLYRVGSNSPIVEALTEARENGKQVAVMLELRARFDEENNIAWARALEDEGVHVVYGVPGLKTHAKMCMVVRREADGIRRYVHLGTGNYNPVTGRLYSDISYFTCDPEIAADVADLFNALTGYAKKMTYRRLLVAPSNLREEVLRRIEREVEHHQRQGGGYIAFKMNALVDKECIRALYRASQAGVKVDLQVRGICCLRPGLHGVSDNILVTSIVGRFLEHSRIYYFANGGNPEVLLGSADLMPRNLDRRVETLFPIRDKGLQRRIVEDILRRHLADNVQARRLLSDGTYERLQPGGATAVNSQEWLLSEGKDGAFLD